MTMDVGGVPLHYEIYGEGKPLMLMHGWMGKIDSWLPVIRDFRGERQLIVVDFPGQGGQTPEPPGAWSVTEHMEMIVELIRALDIGPVDIMAHSFGGRVSILLAATYPELVGRMVLTGCAGLIPKKNGKRKLRGLAYKLARAFVDGPVEKMLGAQCAENMRESLRNRFGSADYRALTPTMRPTFNRVVTQDLRPYLPKIQASTLLIWGRNDESTPLWMGEVMEKEIPDAGLVVLEGAGHFAYLDKYPDFQVIARRFLI